MRDSPGRIFNEFYQVGNFFIGKQLGIKLFDRPFNGKAGIKKKTERFFQALDGLDIHAMAPQSDEIQAEYARRMPVTGRKRRNILHRLGTTAGDRKLSYAHELVHGSKAAYHSIIFHDNMAAERAVVDHNAMISDDAIVGDMGKCHKQIVRTDDRLAAFAGAGIEETIFPDRVVIADMKDTISRL